MFVFCGPKIWISDDRPAYDGRCCAPKARHKAPFDGLQPMQRFSE